MEKITVKGLSGNSTILVGESIKRLYDHLPSAGVFVITDQNVDAIYRHLWDGLPCHVLKPGEASKSLHTAEAIYRWLVDQGADRKAFILGIGGGMVCDLAGFVASTYMRGLDFGFVATSLLAQVDASVGGKNGVNIDGYKNIVGTFNQPKFVFCDTNMLRSLPREELQNGLAEVVKHALIADEAMFTLIENHVGPVFQLDSEVINHLVSRSVQIKAGVVTKDEREAGLRRVLNLGHTWGHAIEKTDGIAHGHAVSIGLVFAASMSVKKGYLHEIQRQRVIDLLGRLQLPVASTTPTEQVFEALLKDKKKEAGHMHFVLMKGIGSVTVEAIPLEELRDFAGLS